MKSDYLIFRGKYFIALIFNLLIFYGLITWFVQSVSIRTLWSDIARVHASSLLIVFALDFFVSFFYALRLAFLLNITYASAFKLICIGNGLNNILPFRLGDAIRIYCGKRYYHIPMDRFVAATFIERYCDLILLLLLGLIFLLGARDQYDTSLITFFSVLLTCAIISVFFYRSITLNRGKVRRWLEAFPVIFRIVEQGKQMVLKRNKAIVFLFSAIIWLGTIFIYYAFFSINLSGVATMSFVAATILCFTATLSFAIPYTIAGIGVFESAIFYYLMHFSHVEATEAVALALIFHCFFALPQIILMLGVFALHKIPNAMEIWRKFSKVS